MPELYPTFETPELAEAQGEGEPAPTYGRSFVFDFEKGDFVLDGAGRVAEADGHVAWAQWCVKAVITERFGYLVYGPAYGCEVAGARRTQNRRAAEAELERAITEALLSDPRTEAVRDFEFEWEGDSVHVSFAVEPVVGTAERIEVSIGG